MNSRDWIANNTDLFDSDYERLFVERVLSGIRDFDFSSLKAQYPFKDAHGRQRFCDFVLQEGDSVRIALEIDGYDKRGTGQGMTRQEFVDWQRRQSALVALGWSVLRFANTDVRDHPRMCQEHVELTLRHFREKSSHSLKLEQAIAHLRNELVEAQRRAGGPTNTQKLTDQIHLLEQQLSYAQKSQPLDTHEQDRLAELNRAQEQILNLQEESSFMKTTIWAFAFVLASVFVALIWKLPAGGHTSSPDAPSHQEPAGAEASLAPPPQPEAKVLSRPAPEPAASEPARLPEVTVAAPAALPKLATRDTADAPSTSKMAAPPLERGASCSSPLIWQEGKQHIGEYVAVSGTVQKITERGNVRGNPLWIEIGETYPSSNRFTLIIWESRREAFTDTDLHALLNKPICAIGRIQEYKDQPQIELSSPNQLHF